jgi:NAD+ kinase
MRRFGLLYHPEIPESLRLARDTEASLRSLGALVWQASAWDEADVLHKQPHTDLLITFGGDGTIVRTARVTAGHDLPILGINLGRLGFLAELEPAELPHKLEALVAGTYWLEERAMLHAETERAQQEVVPFEALNDVVVSRGRVARTVRLDTFIDGQFLTQYVADGVIVATATGSTAYSLSAGGPIVDPRLSDIVLTPIAPHLMVATSLVLPKTSAVRVVLSGENEAACTVDGQVDVALGQGDAVTITTSQHVCYFVRFDKQTRSYRTLLQRLK